MNITAKYFFDEDGELIDVSDKESKDSLQIPCDDLDVMCLPLQVQVNVIHYNITTAQCCIEKY